MVSQLITFGLVVLFLPALFHLALKLRLGIPMLYIVLALTVFHNWTQANPKLADGILFVLVGLAALSWVVTAVRKLCDFIVLRQEDHAAAELFARHIRQAQANGEYAVSADDFWS